MKIPKSKLIKNSYKDRTIIVTGAGSGIGRALSFELAKKNADLILLSRDQEKLDSLQDDIKEKFGIEPLTVEFDFFKAKERDYDFLFENLIDNYKKIDGLIHVAGILGYLSPFTSTSLSQLETVMKVNFESNFLLTKALIPLLEKSECPSVIFTSSGVGRKGRAFWTSYSISKFAVEGLMQVLADEYEGRVKFNTLNPGPTRTKMRAQAFPAEDPLTLKSAQDVAESYLWLLSKECKETGKSYDY
jgi:short-subunit dehydrogenase